MRSSAPFFRAYPFFLPKPGRKIESTSAGKETVDGHKCRHRVLFPEAAWRFRRSNGHFARQRIFTAFPSDFDAQPGTGVHSVIQYKNVVLGRRTKRCSSIPRTARTSTKTKMTTTTHNRPEASATSWWVSRRQTIPSNEHDSWPDVHRGFGNRCHVASIGAPRSWAGRGAGGFHRCFFSSKVC